MTIIIISPPGISPPGGGLALWSNTKKENPIRVTNYSEERTGLFFRTAILRN